MSDQFKRELDVAFNIKVNGNATKALRAAALAAGAAITMGTPVGNPSLWKGKAPPGYAGGAARRNWQTSLNVPRNGTVPGIDPTGATAMAQLNQVAGQFDISKHRSIWLSNNLPYIGALNDGWSTQAPAGFVEEAVRAAVELINREYGR